MCHLHEHWRERAAMTRNVGVLGYTREPCVIARLW